ncbi:MAG: class II aldolase/adducin family protein [Hydrogenophilus sp.]|nr:class II aldolase/adducin family protein [Hydrogenophilus sp.]
MSSSLSSPSTDPRPHLVAAMVRLAQQRLNVGATGNISLRAEGGGLWITPSGIPPAHLTPDQIVFLTADGTALGPWRPSSEWRLHLAIARARPDIAAIVHTHSPAATALSCHRRELPPFHYMIAEFGGPTVRCAPYARFGTEALAAAALEALQERYACLLANHGLIALGATLEQALHRAEALEALCHQYLLAATLGEPVHLTPAEIADALAAFRDYGQQPQQPHPSLSPRAHHS